MLTRTHVEEDQTSTGKPVLADQKEEHEIDFRVPGLSHAVVKEAEHLRVQSRASTLDRKSSSSRSTSCRLAAEQRLQPIQQKKKKSKEMIRELGNVELFELCETTPKVPCSQRLLFWSHGIVY